MNSKIAIIFMAFAITLALSSCKEYKTENGIEYKFIVDSAGPVVELGGAVIVHLTYYNEHDTIDSKKQNQGIPFPIPIPDSIVEKYSLENGLRMLSKGDSASFRISTDSLYNVPRDKMPKEIKEGSMTTFFVKVVDVLSKDSVKIIREKMKQERMAAEMQRQIMTQMQTMTDSIAISDYCKKNGLKPKRTVRGVYYVVKKASNLGLTLQPGDSAQVMYTGKLLNGTQFDSNVGGTPFPVVVGESQVISGWHSGLMALKKGEKATLIIPSALGYGPQPMGNTIPPNSVLVFDVEILK